MRRHYSAEQPAKILDTEQSTQRLVNCSHCSLPLLKFFAPEHQMVDPGLSSIELVASSCAETAAPIVCQHLVGKEGELFESETAGCVRAIPVFAFNCDDICPGVYQSRCGSSIM